MVAAMTRKTQISNDASPVFAHGEATAPRVRQPSSPVTVWAGVVGAGVIGFMVFNGLSEGR
ncbi:MAG: hypothetical protein DI570_24760, partial [Phenylobacterium zucineum]